MNSVSLDALVICGNGLCPEIANDAWSAVDRP
jgi:hypothetical protein